VWDGDRSRSRDDEKWKMQKEPETTRLAACKTNSVLQQEIPVYCRFGCLPCTSKHALERLFVGIFGRAGLNVPHTEGDVSAGAHDNVVFRIYFLVFGLIEAHIPHYSVDESSGERGLP
jgi:hypothetical protein